MNVVMNHTSAVSESVYAGLMKVSDCCSSVIGLLPDPSLQFVPAFLIGICIAASVLIYLVQKKTKEPLSVVVLLFLRQLFTSSSSSLGEQLQDLKIRELRDKVTLRWENQKFKKCSARLNHSVNVFVNNSDTKHSEEDQQQKSTVFHLQKLPSLPWWNDKDVYQDERGLFKSNLPKIKEEFKKVFADFQKGICKQWRKVDLPTGHSCIFPLISRGVINTLNCSSCPATFKALTECMSVGLSGCAFGSASFTLFYPDSTVGPTTAQTNISLQCDVVLQTPATKGELEVSGSQHQWRQDEVLLYDPSFPHSACLASSKDMTVLATPLALLTVDLWHPGLDHGERAVLANLFAG